jgi:hypothetical protein
MGIIYSKCYNGVIRVPGFADDETSERIGNMVLTNALSGISPSLPIYHPLSVRPSNPAESSPRQAQASSPPAQAPTSPRWRRRAGRQRLAKAISTSEAPQAPPRRRRHAAAAATSTSAAPRGMAVAALVAPSPSVTARCTAAPARAWWYRLGASPPQHDFWERRPRRGLRQRRVPRVRAGQRRLWRLRRPAARSSATAAPQVTAARAGGRRRVRPPHRGGGSRRHRVLRVALHPLRSGGGGGGGGVRAADGGGGDRLRRRRERGLGRRCGAPRGRCRRRWPADSAERRHGRGGGGRQRGAPRRVRSRKRSRLAAHGPGASVDAEAADRRWKPAGRSRACI